MITELNGKCALVTGASSGLGVDFARELAARSCSLVLVARRDDLLRKLQAELVQKYGVAVETIAMDLGGRDAAQVLFDQLAAAGKAVDVLINNAGLGLYGAFLEIDWAQERAMLELDMLTLTHLTKLFVRPMVARRWGRILNLSSVGAYQPTPTYATYSAAKSYVLSFSEALNFELKGSGVSSTALSPGITATEFLKVSGQKPTPYQKLMMMTSPSVARIGIRAMLAGRSSIVPGLANSLAAWSTRFTPRRLSTWIAYRVMRTSP